MANKSVFEVAKNIQEPNSDLNQVAFRIKPNGKPSYITAEDFSKWKSNKAMLSRDEVDILYCFAQKLADVKTGIRCEDCDNHSVEMSRDKLKRCYECKMKRAPFDAHVTMHEKDLAVKAIFEWLRVEWLVRVKGWITDLGEMGFSGKKIPVMHRSEIIILTKGITPEDLIEQYKEARKCIEPSKSTFVPAKKVRDRNEAPKCASVEQAVQQAFKI